MEDYENLIKKILQSTGEFGRTEDLVIDAARELIKDEIKNYIKVKLDENPDLKKELKESVGLLLEARTKEAIALMRIAKTSFKLGLNLIPDHLRKQFIQEITGIFEKEVQSILEKTL